MEVLATPSHRGVHVRTRELSARSVRGCHHRQGRSVGEGAGRGSPVHGGAATVGSSTEAPQKRTARITASASNPTSQHFSKEKQN